MKKLFYVFVTAAMFTICSCHTQQNGVTTDDDNIYGVNVQQAWTLKPETLNVAGIDSLRKADKLPKIEKWTSSSFTDDENNVRSIYRTLYDRTTGIVYTLKQLDANTSVLTKRIIKTK